MNAELIKTSTRTEAAWKQHRATRRRIEKNREAYAPSQTKVYEISGMNVEVRTTIKPDGIQVTIRTIEGQFNSTVGPWISLNRTTKLAYGRRGVWADQEVTYNASTALGSGRVSGLGEIVKQQAGTAIAMQVAAKVAEQIAAMPVCPVRPNHDTSNGYDFPTFEV
jgi:hypothetical protein